PSCADLIIAIGNVPTFDAPRFCGDGRFASPETYPCLCPLLGVLDLEAGGRQTKQCSRKAMGCERLQFASALRQRERQEIRRAASARILNETRKSAGYGDILMTFLSICR